MLHVLDQPAPGPDRARLREEHDSTSDANAIVASARYRPWSRIAGNASSAPIGMQIKRGEHDREDAAVLAAEPGVHGRADARERERRERHLAGPAVSGTSESATSAVHMPSAKRFRFVSDRNELDDRPSRRTAQPCRCIGVAHRRDALDALARR